ARAYENFSVNAGSGSQDPQKALTAVMDEIERVKKYGFTAPELERAKMETIASYEKAYNDRDKQESSSYIEEYLRNFLEKEPIPGIAVEFNLVKQFVPAITLQDVNAVTDKIKGKQNVFASIMGPEPKDGMKLPTGDDMLLAIAAAETSNVKPYE